MDSVHFSILLADGSVFEVGGFTVPSITHPTPRSVLTDLDLKCLSQFRGKMADHMPETTSLLGPTTSGSCSKALVFIFHRVYDFCHP